MGLEDSDVWINKSSSGKGFNIEIDGELYVGAMQQLEDFVNGKKEGVQLSVQVEDEEE